MLVKMVGEACACGGRIEQQHSIRDSITGIKLSLTRLPIVNRIHYKNAFPYEIKCVFLRK